MRAALVASFLSAAISALVVVGIYEVRGRRQQPAEAPRSERDQTTAETAPRWAPMNAPAEKEESCTELRRRLERSCPVDGMAQGQAATSALSKEELAELAAAVEWAKPGAAELVELAKHCEIRMDTPDVLGERPRAVEESEAEALALRPSERLELNAVLADLHREFATGAKQAYAEIKGPGANPSEVAASLLVLQIENLAGSDLARARDRLARERAGLPPSGTLPATSSPAERLLRQQAGLGDELEKRLAVRLGADRARELRFSSAGRSWMQRSAVSGCPSP